MAEKREYRLKINAVKVDRQIVAIGKAHGVSCIYSDDEDVVKLGQDCGIQVLRVSDLPLPPAVQTEMFKPVGPPIVASESKTTESGEKNETITSTKRTG